MICKDEQTLEVNRLPVVNKKTLNIQLFYWEGGSRDDAVVRALPFPQCSPGSIPRVGATCGLSVLVLTTPIFLFPKLPTNNYLLC